MKRLAYPLILLLILISCKSEPEVTEVDAERLVGEFMRVKDNGRVGQSQEDAPVVTNITFRSKFCNFTYDGTPMSGKYSVDEGYVYIEVGGDLGTLSLEIVSANQLEGEGWINGSFMREGFEGEYKFIKDKGNWSGGSSGSSNGESSEGNNASSSSNTSDDEASSSASAGGQNNETTNSGSNSGSSAGSETTTATPERYVVQKLNTSTMRSPASAKIALILTVDAQGNVVDTKLNKSKTTTTNEVLVNSVIAEVKKQVKYNKVPGAAYTKMNYTVKL
jgi:hypothetical protein